MHRHALYVLLISVLGLIAIGIVMLFSTSAFAHDSRGDMLYFVKRQGIWLVVGTAVCITAALIDYHWWQRTWYLWFAGATLLLILCFIPPIGMKINGSWRWLNLGFMTLQPSELAKVAAVIFLAWWFTKYQAHRTEFWRGFVLPGLVVTILLALIAMEVDLGTTALIGTVTFSIMFLAGTRLLFLIPVVGLGLGGLLAVAMLIPQRMDRLLAFLEPEKFRLTEGLQQWQALIAFGSGGIDGLGLGEGRQKMLYLPYAHTDFIFPMIGEELGLRFTLAVVLCFLVFTLAGCLIATRARDRFGFLLAMGAILTVAIQAIVNIGVTTSLFPNKGMPLPFISYGGSNLVICLFFVGVLINIFRQQKPLPVPTQAPAMEYRPAMRW
jgi:cell division protein FtsW